MTLKLHHLRPAPGAKKAKTRKGRGEASKGKTAGRGGKGTRARNTVRAGFEGGQLPRNVEFDLEKWVDLIGAVSSEYFIIEDYDDLNPSVKYAFVVIKHAARELKEKGYISFGDQDVEFLGDKLM